MRCSIFLVALLSIHALTFSNTLYVPDDYAEIQEAITAAVSGDTIIVRSGTYVENLDFIGKAITVKSEHGPGATVIDGNQEDIVVMFINQEGQDSRLEGFTISNGNAYCQDGSGVFLFQSFPVLSNNIIAGNTAGSSGGGMHTYQSSPTLIQCSFIGNTARTGGGMFNNLSNPTLIDCFFAENSAVGSYGGGGIYNYLSNPTLIGCFFTGNSGDEGGGMYNNNSNPTSNHCTFSENSASSKFNGGGGVYSYGGHPTFSNCIFSHNSSTFSGGGMYNHSDGLLLANCTFYGNSAKTWGGGLHNVYSEPTVTNCILWENSPSEIYSVPSTPTVSNSCVRGGFPGTGNIDSNPLFADPFNGDLHLTFPSPCKDTGDNSAVIDPSDFEGDPRIADGTVDMGADEFYTHLYVTGDKTPGGTIEGKLVGLPGTSPVGLYVGSGVLTSPINTMWGEFWLQSPWIQFGPLGAIPFQGIMILATTLPPGMTVPVDVPMQALIGLNADSLTNLFVLEVR